MNIVVRPATLDDFDQLYQLGLATPEIQVDLGVVFMEAEEFRAAIASPAGVFLLAEVAGRLGGFIFANTHDIELPRRRWACLVYVVVEPHLRRQGIAEQLYRACEARLQAHGITHLYFWADPSLAELLRNQPEFSVGKCYVWVQKALAPAGQEAS